MNRNELKEYYRKLKSGQQSEYVGNRKQKKLLSETTTPTLSQIKAAQKALGTSDPYELSSYLGAHPDEIEEIMSADLRSSFEHSANRDLPGALENLAADVQDMIDNAVGQVDLDFSDDPLTKRDILDFVIRMLTEEMAVTPSNPPPTNQPIGGSDWFDDRDDRFSDMYHK